MIRALQFGQCSATSQHSLMGTCSSDSSETTSSSGFHHKTRQVLLKQKGARFLEPMKGRPMKDYVITPKTWMNDADTVRIWVSRSLAWSSKLPAKKGKNRNLFRYPLQSPLLILRDRIQRDGDVFLRVRGL